jgi:hypothetical protein
MPNNSIRTVLSDDEIKEFKHHVVELLTTSPKLLHRIVTEWLGGQRKVIRHSIGIRTQNVSALTTPVSTRTGLISRHINTRQVAKFKHLKEIDSKCQLDKQTLYYSKEHEEAILDYLSKVSTGGRRKNSGQGLPLRITKRGTVSTRPKRNTHYQKVVAAIQEILVGQILRPEDIYDQLRDRHCLPNGDDIRGSLKRILRENKDLFEHDKGSGYYYLRSGYQDEEPQDPPESTPAPASVAPVESAPTEATPVEDPINDLLQEFVEENRVMDQDSGKLSEPSFFPISSRLTRLS